MDSFSTDDNGDDLSNLWWDDALTLLHDKLVVREKPTLIHCHMGVNRAPSLAGVVLVAFYNYHPSIVWKMLRSCRPMAWAYYLPNGYRWLATNQKWLQVRDVEPEALLTAADDIEQQLRLNKDSIDHVIRTIRVMERNREVVTQKSVSMKMK